MGRAQPLPFLVLPAPRLPDRTRGAARSAVLSVVAHACAAAGLALTLSTSDRPSPDAPSQFVSARPQIPRIVFLQVPGPGGGGGGGGNRQSAPPPPARAIGRDQMTLPVRRAVRAAREPADTVTPPQLVALHAVPLAAGISYQTGLPDASPSPVLSHGPGEGGGVGGGSGTGIGSGVGPGYGPGSGGGFGGGAHRPGNGVTAPTLLTQVKPLYTSEAMQRKIQGAVVLEVVVAASGAPSDIRIKRSLDQYGLDQEAIRAVRQWRFTPGRLGNEPVDVLVTIVLEFHIR